MKVKVTPSVVFNLFMVTLFAYVVISAADWRISAKLFPWAIGIPALVLTALQILIDQRRAARPKQEEDMGGLMDLPVDSNTPTSVVIQRAGTAFAWVFGLFFGIWLIGFLIAVPVFIAFYLRLMAKTNWFETAAFVAAMLAFLFGVFHYILHVPWLDPIISWPQDAIISIIGG